MNNSSLGAALEFIRSSKPQKDIEKSNPGTLGINLSSTVAREIDYNALSSTTPDSSQSGQDNSEGLEDTATESSLVINIPNPVFCRDGVSAQLEAMYCAAGVKTQHEALFVIIHALMLESGFQSKVFPTDTPGVAQFKKTAVR